MTIDEAIIAMNNEPETKEKRQMITWLIELKDLREQQLKNWEKKELSKVKELNEWKKAGYTKGFRDGSTKGEAQERQKWINALNERIGKKETSFMCMWIQREENQEKRYYYARQKRRKTSD